MSKKLLVCFFFFLGLISILCQVSLLREITNDFYGNELFYALGLSFWLLFTGLGSLIGTRLTLKIKPVYVWCLLVLLFLGCLILIILFRWLIFKLTPFGLLPSPWLSWLCLILFGLISLPLGLLFTLVVGSFAKQQKFILNQAYLWETLGISAGGLLLSLVLIKTSFPLTDSLNKFTLNWHYPALTKVINSRYGQIIITENQGQTNFFVNGQFFFSNEESEANRKLLNLLKPLINNPQRALLIASPTLSQNLATQLNFSNIDFPELDPQLANLELPFLSKEVNLIKADPRQFLQNQLKIYDLVLLSLGNPQSLAVNRYYTVEFFNLIKQSLNTNGIFTLILSLPSDYQSIEAIRFLASINSALHIVFPWQKIIVYEDQLVLVNSKSELNPNLIMLTDTDKQQFNYYWQSVRNNTVEAKLLKTPAKINRDLAPAAFFYQNLFWQTIFSFSLPKIWLRFASFLPWFLLLGLILAWWKLKFFHKFKTIIILNSFLLMSLEIIIILLYQTKIGNLYSYISLLLALILIGMAVGIKLTQLMIKRIKGLIKIYFLFYLILGLLISLTNQISLANYPLFWFILALLSGSCAGGIFSLTNLKYPKTNNTILYTYDLWGGCCGAILTTLFLLPLWGINGLVVICGLIFIFVAFSPV